MLPWIKKNRDELIVGLILTIIQVSSEAYFQKGEDGPEPTEQKATQEVRPVIVQRPDPVEPEPESEPSPQPPPPPEGWDKLAGKDFDIYVLSEDYGWQRGSSNNVVAPGGIPTNELQQEMHKLVSQPQWSYGDLIAVGTASCEGEAFEEGRRARERARQIAIWTRRALYEARRSHEVHTLSLGKYARDCSDSALIRTNPRLTDDQRRVILIACKSQNIPANLGTALKELMKKDRPFGIHPDDYTEFVLDHWGDRP